MSVRFPRIAPLVRSLGRGIWSCADPEWGIGVARLRDDGHEAREVFAKLPVGFESDLYSSPWMVRPFIPRDEMDNRPAFAHDLLYSTLGLRPHWADDSTFSRAECDAVLLLMMTACGFSRMRARTIYTAVRAGGWLPWMRLDGAGHSWSAPAMASNRVSRKDAKAQRGEG
jgi:hypothetical protein